MDRLATCSGGPMSKSVVKTLTFSSRWSFKQRNSWKSVYRFMLGSGFERKMFGTPSLSNAPPPPKILAHPSYSTDTNKFRTKRCTWESMGQLLAPFIFTCLCLTAVCKINKLFYLNEIISDYLDNLPLQACVLCSVINSIITLVVRTSFKIIIFVNWNN